MLALGGGPIGALYGRVGPARGLNAGCAWSSKLKAVLLLIGGPLGSGGGREYGGPTFDIGENGLCCCCDPNVFILPTGV